MSNSIKGEKKESAFWRRFPHIIGAGAVLIAFVSALITFLEYNAGREADELNAFRQAVANLGNERPASARLGILYLSDLAKNSPARSADITEILSSHLRETTQTQKYQEAHKGEPSVVIQFLMGKLSELNDANLRRKETRDIRLNLEKSYLRGANLAEKNLHGAKLQGANLQGANLFKAQLQGANLDDVQLQGADLAGAQLQGANIRDAKLQGAVLAGAQLQGANMFRAELQMTKLDGAQLQGAFLGRAQLQGAILVAAQLYGTIDGGFTIIEPGTSNNCKGGNTVLATIKRRIKERTGQDTSFEKENTVFSGGLTEDEITKIEEVLVELANDGLFNKEAADQLPEVLRNHHMGKESYEPESPIIFTGILTEEMAKEIIEDYKDSTMLDESESTMLDESERGCQIERII